ncbi:hypothetical protein GUITHDRAFT_90067 [Guillardia theta CCMP2712]|uniref:GCVT N-terminal domain-containing protein n=1 Tax=Guillardia theta (strain CCMP2712) TaxID=905079 RepID=L1IIL6_GUITC|nr:hypothetical protein GUITHDRAFT_90067 [Guillardia theta CCMP2712]EKX36076.1 hypothetical protein GUITHDRAFT_90067 [Guillardia theta CCMP2712]|eukprot:XP_005823056.1 hypothetical protein GUITHDRAFT_90067 [Guillardia theta CCMP2712]
MLSVRSVAVVLLLSTTTTVSFNVRWSAVRPLSRSGSLPCPSRRNEPRTRMRRAGRQLVACSKDTSEQKDATQSLAAIAEMERRRQQEEEMRNSGSIGWECLRDTPQSKQELRELQLKFGAEVVPATYPAPEPLMKFMKKGRDRVVDVVSKFSLLPQAEVIAASSSGVLLADLSHWGALVVTGEDRYKFLSGLCTNRVVGLRPGDVRQACFLSKVGRTVDLCTIAVLSDSLLVLCSPNRVLQLFQDLDALIFPKDKVKCLDVSEGLARFHLVGPKAEEFLSQMPGITLPEPFCSSPLVLEGKSMNGLVLHGAGCSVPGYTIVAASGDGRVLWEEFMKVAEPGPLRVGQEGWEVLRMVDGVPAAGSELTLEYNPLEAGLWSTVSFDKGCYIGQESMARLKTYDGVKQNLWAIQFPADKSGAKSSRALVGAKLFAVSACESGQSRRLKLACEGEGRGRKIHRDDHVRPPGALAHPR